MSQQDEFRKAIEAIGARSGDKEGADLVRSLIQKHIDREIEPTPDSPVHFEAPPTTLEGVLEQINPDLLNKPAAYLTDAERATIHAALGIVQQRMAEQIAVLEERAAKQPIEKHPTLEQFVTLENAQSTKVVFADGSDLDLVIDGISKPEVSIGQGETGSISVYYPRIAEVAIDMQGDQIIYTFTPDDDSKEKVRENHSLDENTIKNLLLNTRLAVTRLVLGQINKPAEPISKNVHDRLPDPNNLRPSTAKKDVTAKIDIADATSVLTHGEPSPEQKEQLFSWFDTAAAAKNREDRNPLLFRQDDPEKRDCLEPQQLQFSTQQTVRNALLDAIQSDTGIVLSDKYLLETYRNWHEKYMRTLGTDGEYTIDDAQKAYDDFLANGKAPPDTGFGSADVYQHSMAEPVSGKETLANKPTTIETREETLKQLEGRYERIKDLDEEALRAMDSVALDQIREDLLVLGRLPSDTQESFIQHMGIDDSTLTQLLTEVQALIPEEKRDLETTILAAKQLLDKFAQLKFDIQMFQNKGNSSNDLKKAVRNLMEQDIRTVTQIFQIDEPYLGQHIVQGQLQQTINALGLEKETQRTYNYKKQFDALAYFIDDCHGDLTQFTNEYTQTYKRRYEHKKGMENIGIEEALRRDFRTLFGKDNLDAVAESLDMAVEDLERYKDLFVDYLGNEYDHILESAQAIQDDLDTSIEQLEQDEKLQEFAEDLNIICQALRSRNKHEKQEAKNALGLEGSQIADYLDRLDKKANALALYQVENPEELEDDERLLVETLFAANDQDWIDHSLSFGGYEGFLRSQATRYVNGDPVSLIAGQFIDNKKGQARLENLLAKLRREPELKEAFNDILFDEGELTDLAYGLINDILCAYGYAKIHELAQTQGGESKRQENLTLNNASSYEEDSTPQTPPTPPLPNAPDPSSAEPAPTQTPDATPTQETEPTIEKEDKRINIDLALAIKRLDDLPKDPTKVSIEKIVDNFRFIEKVLHTGKGTLTKTINKLNSDKRRNKELKHQNGDAIDTYCRILLDRFIHNALDNPEDYSLSLEERRFAETMVEHLSQATYQIGKRNVNFGSEIQRAITINIPRRSQRSTNRLFFPSNPFVGKQAYEVFENISSLPGFDPNKYNNAEVLARILYNYTLERVFESLYHPKDVLNRLEGTDLDTVDINNATQLARIESDFDSLLHKFLYQDTKDERIKKRYTRFQSELGLDDEGMQALYQKLLANSTMLSSRLYEKYSNMTIQEDEKQTMKALWERATQSESKIFLRANEDKNLSKQVNHANQDGYIDLLTPLPHRDSHYADDMQSLSSTLGREVTCEEIRELLRRDYYSEIARRINDDTSSTDTKENNSDYEKLREDANNLIDYINSTLHDKRLPIVVGEIPDKHSIDGLRNIIDNLDTLSDVTSAIWKIGFIGRITFNFEADPKEPSFRFAPDNSVNTLKILLNTTKLDQLSSDFESYQETFESKLAISTDATNEEFEGLTIFKNLDGSTYAIDEQDQKIESTAWQSRLGKLFTQEHLEAIDPNLDIHERQFLLNLYIEEYSYPSQESIHEIVNWVRDNYDEDVIQEKFDNGVWLHQAYTKFSEEIGRTSLINQINFDKEFVPPIYLEAKSFIEQALTKARAKQEEKPLFNMDAKFADLARRLIDTQEAHSEVASLYKEDLARLLFKLPEFPAMLDKKTIKSAYREMSKLYASDTVAQQPELQEKAQALQQLINATNDFLKERYGDDSTGS